MIDNKSTQIIDMTSAALAEVPDALSQFHSIFISCATEFENGNDNVGLQQFQEALPHLGKFANFCVFVLDGAGFCLSADCKRELENGCVRLEKYLKSLLGELADGDYVMAADIIRCDLVPLVDHFFSLFATVKESLQDRAASISQTQNLAVCSGLKTEEV